MTAQPGYIWWRPQLMPEVSLGERIAEARERAGYRTQADAAREATRLASIDPKRFRAFSQQWLSRLEGDRTGDLVEGANRPRLRTLEHILGLDLGGGRAATGDELERELGPRGDEVTPVGTVRLPIRDLAMAGRPIDPDGQGVLDWVDIGESKWFRGLDLYQATGNSMQTADARSIYEGDTLYVDSRDREPRDGQIYVIRIPGDGVAVKRLQLFGDTFWLTSDNPGHARFRVDEAEIIGRVVRWTRDMEP
jgi:SOS-response transcriptional repressor LexA